MSKFSLNNIGKQLSEKSGLSQMEAELFIRKMFDVCNQGLDADKQVKIKWLGTFKIQAVKDRESINVNTGERIVIEGRDKLSFTPDNILKEIVNKPFAQFETVVVNDGVDFDAIDKKFENEEIEENIAAAEEPAITEEQVIEDQPITEEVAAEVPAIAKEPAAEEETVAEHLSEVINFLEKEDSPEQDAQVIVIGKKQEEEPAEQPIEEPTEAPANEESANKESADEEPTDEEPAVSHGNHIMIPRYMLVVATLTLLLLIGGMGWFAYNYGKMAAQRDNLALQLSQYHKATAKPAPVAPTQQETQEQQLRQKAIEDSIRMAQASKTIKAAENKEKEIAEENTAEKVQESCKNTADSKQNIAAQKQKTAEGKQKTAEGKQKTAEGKQKTAEGKQKAANHSSAISSQYDSDARVRTGAYRIIGVAQTVTVKAGQSLESLSKYYLGPGMECYVEALNGTTSVKAGQKIKIPKLEIKKKSK